MATSTTGAGQQITGDGAHPAPATASSQSNGNDDDTNAGSGTQVTGDHDAIGTGNVARRMATSDRQRRPDTGANTSPIARWRG